MAFIELSGITKRYIAGDTETEVLHGIDLAVEQGELAAIVGPSGSGKSTLMHILGLLDSPTEGEYRLDGKTMNGLSDHKLARLRRSDIGFVFQSFNLLSRLSVIQNLILPMVYDGVPARERRPRALKLLKMVGIENRANYRVNQISGGEVQRVAVARALANEPKLILADEPTGNLDTKNSQSVVDLLKRLHKLGHTIIIVTHNPRIADQTGRTIEIVDGKIVSDTKHGAGTRRRLELDPEATLHHSANRGGARRGSNL